MKKHFVVFGLLLVLSVSLFAGAQKEEVIPAGGVELVLVSHKIHENMLRGLTGTGRDLIQEFIDMTPEVSKVTFITAGVEEVRDKLFREASLNTTDINIGFVYTPWITSAMPDFFADLSEFEKNNPIENKEDIFSNLVAELTFNNKLYAVPLRASGQGLFYNKNLLKERGINIADIKTSEDLILAIKASAFTRPNGEAIYGITKQGLKEELPFVVGDFLRSKNGDYIDRDLKLYLSDPRVAWALDVYRDFYANNVIPKNFTAMTNADSVELFKSGKAAFTIAGPGYLANYTGACVLKADDFVFVNLPSSEEVSTQYPVSPTVTFQWAIAIPKNAKYKNLAWDLIQYVTTKDAILQTVFSGNEPVRESVFSNQQYLASQPFPTQQRNIFTYGRPLFPGFDEYPEFISILGEEMQNAVLGNKTSKQALSDAETKIQNLF